MSSSYFSSWSSLIFLWEPRHEWVRSLQPDLSPPSRLSGSEWGGCCTPIIHNCFTSFHYLGFIIRSKGASIIFYKLQNSLIKQCFYSGIKLLSFFMSEVDKVLTSISFKIRNCRPSQTFIADFMDTFGSFNLSRASEVLIHRKCHSIAPVLYGGLSPCNLATKGYLCIWFNAPPLGF